MTIIVKTISSWVKLLIFLFGIYIVLFGHLTPGGGFAGGAMIASAYVLLMLAFGGEFAEKNLPLPVASKLDCVAVLLFAAIALFGLLYGDASFFWNFIHQEYQLGEPLRLFSAGTIPLSNIAIALKVATSLFLVVLVLSLFRPDISSHKN